MATEIIFPKVDMDMEEGRIARWHAKAGDKITKGQPLFEIETDKAAMEIDAPVDGILDMITAKEGETVPVGKIVAWIYAEGEARQEPSKYITIPVLDVKAAVAESIAQQKARLQESHPQNSQNRSSQDPFQEHFQAQEQSGAVRATPLARRLAREAGIELATLRGSGPQGRVQRKDVEEARAQKHIVPAKTVPQHVDGVDPSSELLHAVWLREGQAGKLPVVLVHGFGADLNSWRGLFAGSDFPHPLLAIDLPAHGLSPHSVPKSLDDIAAHLEATLISLGVTSCLLVGHSLGGAVSAVVTARCVMDVRTLLLISPAGLGAEINGTFLNGFLHATSEASLMPWLKLLVEDETFLSKSFVNATLAQAQNLSLREAQKEIARRLFADSTQTFDIKATLTQIQAPIRLIFGATDRIIPASHARGLPGKIGVHIFSDCGHLPQIEERAAVLDILHQCARATSAT